MALNQDDNWRQKTYKNREFINSHDARHIRILCELQAPQSKFSEHQIENTISVFGSARAISGEEANKKLIKLQEDHPGKDKNSESFKEKLKKAEIAVKLSKYYDQAADLAEMLTKWSMEIIQQEKRFYICSGGGPGIMEAVNLGAARAGGPSIGLNISLPFEQHPNIYQTKKLSFEFHYFFIRKFWFAYLAKALVIFPGGLGTMDELFELLTLLQTKKIEKVIPIVLFGTDYWNDLINFEAMIDWGMIDKEDLDLFRICNDVEEAFEYLKKSMTENYL